MNAEGILSLRFVSTDLTGVPLDTGIEELFADAKRGIEDGETLP